MSVLASGLKNPSFWVAVPESLALPEINRPPWWGRGAAELLGEEKNRNERKVGFLLMQLAMSKTRKEYMLEVIFKKQSGVVFATHLTGRCQLYEKI
ncbi:hypothetical protein [Marinomonas primoryensis]|uniref:hypothetical protein n=1 Tax=Marinomonas primoryensis TaxID=178399 RepID=UPI0030DDCB3A